MGGGKKRYNRGLGKMNKQSLIFFSFSILCPVPPAFTLVGLARNWPQISPPPTPPHGPSPKAAPTAVSQWPSPSGALMPLQPVVPTASRRVPYTCEKLQQFFFLFSKHGKTVQAQRLNKPALHPWIVLNHWVPQPPYPPLPPRSSFPVSMASSKAAQSSNDIYYFISLSCYIYLSLYIFVYPIYT